MDVRYRRAVTLAGLLGLLLLAAAGPAVAQEKTGPGPVTIHAENTSAAEILEILAERSGLNIVATAEAQARTITIHLKETPFEEALNIVVRAAGLSYERIGNSIVVADAQRLGTPSAPVTHIFTLEYADPVEVARVLQVFSDDVAPDVRSHQVVLRAGWAEVEEAARIVAQMDRKPQQVLLEARLIEVNRTKLEELGIDWEEITKWTTIVTEGIPETGPTGRPPSEMPYLEFDKGARWGRQAASFEVILDALITNGSARMLANSKVVTIDGVPANIFAGETVPVVITSLQSPGAGGGVFQTVQLEKIDVGVELNITPRITGEGFITTLVEPKISRIIQFVGPDDDLPQTSERRAKTLVRVKDGQKIFLGGLLSEETKKTVKKVPLLGQLPIIGLVFQHHRNENIRLDLVIEITPRIVGDEGAGLPVSSQEIPAATWEELQEAKEVLEPAAEPKVDAMEDRSQLKRR